VKILEGGEDSENAIMIIPVSFDESATTGSINSSYFPISLLITYTIVPVNLASTKQFLCNFRHLFNSVSLKIKRQIG
jgi:hypothetical protein